MRIMMPKSFFKSFPYLLLMLMVFLISSLSSSAVGFYDPKWDIYKIVAIIIIFVVLSFFAYKDDNAKKNTENLGDIKLIADLISQRDGMKNEEDRKKITYLIDKQLSNLIPYKKMQEIKENKSIPQESINEKILEIRKELNNK